MAILHLFILRHQVQQRIGTRQIARDIAEESVRRHYIQAFGERIAAFFPDLSRRPRQERGEGNRRQSYDQRAYDQRGGDRRGNASGGQARRPIAISDRLRRSTIMSGRNALSLREIVLVMTMINHPGLIQVHLDEFAAVELNSPDLDRLRTGILEIATDGEEWEAAALRTRLMNGPFAALVARLDAQIEAIGHWPARPHAALSDAEEGWLQALTLHRRKGTLHKELKEAENALADMPSEANLARLVDIQNQLASTEGTEALIEGFGTSSGREKRVF